MSNRERRRLRIAGLAGILAAAGLILSFVGTAIWIIAVGGPRRPDPGEILPVVVQYRTVFGAFAVVIVVALLLAMVLFVALHDLLRETSLGRFGALLGIISVVLMAVGTLQVWVGTNEIAELYVHGSLDERALNSLLPLLGSLTEAVLTVASGFFLAMGFLALGTAIFESGVFPKRYGW